eukprot:12729314-Ditylum_brightwellii.AAC.1
MNIGGVFGGKWWSGSGETGRGGIIFSLRTLGSVCGSVGFGGSSCATGTLGAVAGFSVGPLGCGLGCTVGNRA